MAVGKPHKATVKLTAATIDELAKELYCKHAGLSREELDGILQMADEWEEASEDKEVE